MSTDLRFKYLTLKVVARVHSAPCFAGLCCEWGLLEPSLGSDVFVFQRIQASILKAFNNPTTKTADDETRKKVKGMLTLLKITSESSLLRFLLPSEAQGT